MKIFKYKYITSQVGATPEAILQVVMVNGGGGGDGDGGGGGGWP